MMPRSLPRFAALWLMLPLLINPACKGDRDARAARRAIGPAALLDGHWVAWEDEEAPTRDVDYWDIEVDGDQVLILPLFEHDFAWVGIGTIEGDRLTFEVRDEYPVTAGTRPSQATIHAVVDGGRIVGEAFRTTDGKAFDTFVAVRLDRRVDARSGMQPAAAAACNRAAAYDAVSTYTPAGPTIMIKTHLDDQVLTEQLDGTTSQRCVDSRFQGTGAIVLSNLPLFGSIDETAIYPGALLDAQAFADGSLIKLSDYPRGPGSIWLGSSATLIDGASGTLEVTDLSAAAMAASMRTLARQINTTGAQMEYLESSAESEEELSFDIGAAVKVADVGSSSLNVSFSDSTTKSYAFVAAKQIYYTVYFSPKDDSRYNFFETDSICDALSADGPMSPIYVDHVTYGRYVIFTAESSDYSVDLKAALSAGVSAEGVDASGSLSTAYRQALQNAVIRYQIIGGSAQAVPKVITASDPVAGIKAAIADADSQAFGPDSPGIPLSVGFKWVKNMSWVVSPVDSLWTNTKCEQFPTASTEPTIDYSWESVIDDTYWDTYVCRVATSGAGKGVKTRYDRPISRHDYRRLYWLGIDMGGQSLIFTLGGGNAAGLFGGDKPHARLRLYRKTLSTPADGGATTTLSRSEVYARHFHGSGGGWQYQKKLNFSGEKSVSTIIAPRYGTQIRGECDW